MNDDAVNRYDKSQSPSNARSAVLRCLEVPSSQRTAREELESIVWINDPDTAYRLAKVVEQRGDKLVVGFRDENGFYEKRTVLAADTQSPSLSYYVEDLCNLSELTDANVLHAIRCRYESQLIHTYSGLFCVVVNPWRNLAIYSEDIMHEYANALDRSSNLPPHIYAVAQSAYDGLFNGPNQSILITGESGAGKTENTKKIIEYLGFEARRRSGVERNGNGADKRLAAANFIIESFANASTIHNSNSSRVGKFIRIDFGEDMQLKGAQIQCYLLEKSRVVSQNEGDRNFHIFYQLFSEGFSEGVRYGMGLGQSADAYRFLNQGGKTADRDINDEKCAYGTEHALDVVGFSEEEKLQIYETVASCVLLGEIKFHERSGLDITYVDGKKEVEAACRSLGVKTSRFIDALTAPSMRVGDTVIKKSQNLRKTLSSLAALCKCIYERLFNFILAKCNDALGKSFSLESSSKTNYIGVLDMAGFEIMKMNSFEQFCVNYTNEKLQQFFNDFMFIREQKEYMREGIEWQEVDYGTDMQNTIELIEKPLGLLSLLQEECVVPNGSDQSLLEKLLTTHSSNPVFARSKQSARNTTIAHFSVVHYAGKVQYNIDGWVEKNKDAVERSGLDVLSESKKPILQALFPKPKNGAVRPRKPSLCASTVSHMYKEQLLNLLETLNTTRAQFIRCISPNDHRQPGFIDSHLVLHQLRCNGVLEGVRICRQGYPNRLPFDEFINRYKLLSSGGQFEADSEGASQLCRILKLDPARAQIGTTKVFCKVGVISQLESRRRAQLSAIVCGIQATIRWYNEQLRFSEKLKERNATLTIQRNVRTYVELSTWKWYRLYGHIKEMIPMNKDRERLEELENENEQLLHEISDVQEHCEEVQALLNEALAKIRALEHEKNERDEEKQELRAEMLKNEEVLALMERRFDEQHKKVMKIHSHLRENEKKLEQVEAEKVELQNDICKWKEKYERENVRRLDMEHEFGKNEKIANALQQKLDALLAEREREKGLVEKLEADKTAMNEKNAEQLDKINQLQRNICELTEKFRDFDSLIAAEKKARRRAETEKEDRQSELEHALERLQKSDVKIGNLTELCRDKDKQIKKLQDKLDDTIEKSEVNVNELKKIHKQSKNDLQNRIDELKKTVQKLENENRTQKIKIDSSERESSVESDYVSGRQSRLGSRQYSLTSMSSFSSIRTLNSRRTTEPEVKVTSDWRNHSSSILNTYNSYQRPTPTESYSLSRSQSQSQMANERKIAQLERQIMSAHTDIEIQKREIEVYKASLVESEKERDSLSQKVRKMAADASAMERSFAEEERKAHESELRLKKVQEELTALKQKHDKSLTESRCELREEKKRMRQKMEDLIKEQEAKRVPRNAHLEKTLEETQMQLAETRSQLDRAVTQITHLESLSKSQGAYGETWENQYRMAMTELEALRDENAALKMKIRRQYKQIELLTQQSQMEADVADLENRIGIKDDERNIENGNPTVVAN